SLLKNRGQSRFLQLAAKSLSITLSLAILTTTPGTTAWADTGSVNTSIPGNANASDPFNLSGKGKQIVDPSKYHVTPTQVKKGKSGVTWSQITGQIGQASPELIRGAFGGGTRGIAVG